MKEIQLQIADDVFKDIKDHLMIRGMTGEMGGLLDAALVRIIQSIEGGQGVCVLQRKKGVKSAN